MSSLGEQYHKTLKTLFVENGLMTSSSYGNAHNATGSSAATPGCDITLRRSTARLKKRPRSAHTSPALGKCKSCSALVISSRLLILFVRYARAELKQATAGLELFKPSSEGAEGFVERLSKELCEKFTRGDIAVAMRSDKFRSKADAAIHKTFWDAIRGSMKK